jgi:hypothetical protein
MSLWVTYQLLHLPVGRVCFDLMYALAQLIHALTSVVRVHVNVRGAEMSVATITTIIN